MKLDSLPNGLPTRENKILKKLREGLPLTTPLLAVIVTVAFGYYQNVRVKHDLSASVLGYVFDQKNDWVYVQVTYVNKGNQSETIIGAEPMLRDKDGTMIPFSSVKTVGHRQGATDETESILLKPGNSATRCYLARFCPTVVKEVHDLDIRDRQAQSFGIECDFLDECGTLASNNLYWNGGETEVEFEGDGVKAINFSAKETTLTLL